MKRLLVFLTCLATAPAVELPLMPWPASITQQTGSLAIDGTFSIGANGDGAKDPRIAAAIARTYARLKRQTGIPFLTPGATPALILIVESHDHKGPQRLGDDESYSLVIDSAHARLSAEGPLGVLRGLDTLLQLVQEDAQGFSIPAVTIRDQPRFAWRGLSLDVARHFIPADEVERTIDGMSAVKLNVLHWHLSDDQGFRIESKKYPRLQQYGSDGQYYTQAEVREIVAYARDRGIRIVPEFDMPGHSASWLPGYPMLASVPGPFELYRHYSGFADILDPSKSSTYRFLDGFLGEMAKLFPDEYFHIGGDEVSSREWNENPKIRAFMHQHHLANGAQLQVYFNRQVLKIIARHGKKMEGWDEVLQPDLPNTVVIQSWRGAQSLWQAVRDGHGAILSAGYYLDLMKPAAEHYAIDPLKDAPADLTPDQRKLIYGGEAAMWEEYCTADNLDSRLWPRLAAIAERFWSPASVTDAASMYNRLEQVDRWLEWLGLTQHSNLVLLRRRLAGEPFPALDTFAEMVEPAKGYSRHYQQYTPGTPLNRLIDSVPPESDAARHFRSAVDDYLSGARTPERSASLRLQLSRWADSISALRPLLARDFLLNDDAAIVDQAAAVLEAGQSAIAHLDANQSMTKPQLKTEGKPELIVAITPAVQKLLDAVTSN